MKIAIFTDSFCPGIGGTEKAVLGLSEAYTKLGHEVLVACPKFDNSSDNYPFLVCRAKSIKVTKNDRLAFPSLSKKFKKDIENFKPDIIHCQTVSSIASYGIKYAKKHNIPVVITVHTKFREAFYHDIKSKLIVNQMLKDITKKLKKCSSIFTVCNNMINEIESYGFKDREKIKVIRNGAMFDRIVDFDELKEIAQQKYDLKDSDNILLFVGRINKVKNIDFILNVLELLRDKYNLDNFKMIFVGEGPDLNYFKNKTKRMNLGNNILFTGAITDRKLLSSLYVCSDLFVFPSIFDNDPLVVVEASLARTPSITIKNSGSSERIENNVSGFVVDNSEMSFADKIYELLNNKKILKEVGQNAEKFIPRTWEETANEYLKEYNKLLTNHIQTKTIQKR